MKKYKYIFLVAWKYEIEKLFVPLGFKKTKKITPYDVYELGDVGLVQTGIAKTQAAAATQWAIDNYQPEKWINIGLCGTINANYRRGDVLVVSECRFHDLDVRGINPEYKIGQVDGEEYIYKLERILAETLPAGKCISGDLFVTDKSRIREIIEEYDPDILEMEVTAIAKVMKINGQLEKFSSLKIVSDNADEEAGNNASAVEDDLLIKAKETINYLLEV